MIKLARKIIIAVIGLTIVLIGIIMLVTPGPAIIVIPLGLAVLATEFVWAKRILRRVREDGMKVGTAILKSMPFYRPKKKHNPTKANPEIEKSKVA
ncbi:hypothetical protein CEE37_04540 [candidate division LCP-89 bacterium B3_LCP]|uniref:Tellurium resistance protein TerC n=1 Tax=candidate division LCP-89 bacterium B3_LCP TaxID=2012998 RepID=A0A532V3P4_UNCL8|nr:MAG: hypothetical protein CEE37_04540 [candidate division LCP-89 bacterium B3_LCP]